MKRIALITGITGQDGSYIAELVAFGLAADLTRAVPVANVAFDQSDRVWREIEAVAVSSDNRNAREAKS